MQNVIDNLSLILGEWWINMLDRLPQFITGALVLILSLYLAKFFSRMLKKGLTLRNTDPELTILITRLGRWSVVTLGIVLALQQAGQDVSALLTGLGILGFTIGFALQDVSANFVAGILLLIQQPFDIGDAIEAGDFSGTVLRVELRHTEMLTGDGRRVMIPNSDIFTTPIINYSRTERRRLEFDVGVAYDSDLDEVEKVAVEAIANLQGILQDPAPQVIFKTFGDTTINFTLYYWFDTGLTGSFTAKDAGVRAIKKAFEEAKIDMPYPTQVVILQK